MRSTRGRYGRSVALVAFESDQPAEAVTVDHLSIGCAPRSRLQVIQDTATFGETGEPVAQGGWGGRTKQGQHDARAAEWGLIAGHVGGEERDRPRVEVAVGDGIRRAIAPAELVEGVELYGAAEDFAIKVEGVTSSARKMQLGRRCGHGRMLGVEGRQPLTSPSAPRVPVSTDGSRHDRKHRSSRSGHLLAAI